jgi:hypothetical protein
MEKGLWNTEKVEEMMVDQTWSLAGVIYTWFWPMPRQ